MNLGKGNNLQQKPKFEADNCFLYHVYLLQRQRNNGSSDCLEVCQVLQKTLRF